MSRVQIDAQIQISTRVQIDTQLGGIPAVLEPEIGGIPPIFKGLKKAEFRLSGTREVDVS